MTASKRLQICVSGNVGSGKTTLSKILCTNLGFTYIPQRRPDSKYLTDLFTFPDRWAFEAQTAFLMNKATSIISAAASGLDVVVDRSISEDVQVFAKLFQIRGQMSDRGYATYLQVASLALRSVPPPTLVIYCACDATECEKRVLNRGQRDFEKLYPAGHIQFIGNLYEEWLKTVDYCPVFGINTQQIDLRCLDMERKVVSDIRKILQTGMIADQNLQVPLFENTVSTSTDSNLRLLSLHKNPETHLNSPIKLRTKRGVKVPTSPFAYIAAPFTGMSLTEVTLFNVGKRGEIKPGPYRDTLLSIERSLQSYGIASVVPHRDDSKWGKKPLAPRELVEWCSVQVQHCSLVCAIPSNSSGVHYELGLARAWQKPMIIFEREDKSDSTISRGLSDAWDILRIRYKDITDIPTILRGEQCKDFLRKVGLV